MNPHEFFHQLDTDTYRFIVNSQDGYVGIEWNRPVLAGVCLPLGPESGWAARAQELIDLRDSYRGQGR